MISKRRKQDTNASDFGLDAMPRIVFELLKIDMPGLVDESEKNKFKSRLGRDSFEGTLTVLR